MIADRQLYLGRLAKMPWSACAATCKTGAYICRVKRLHRGTASSYGHLRPRRNLRQSRPAARPLIWQVKSCRWTRYWMRWRLAAGGYYWKPTDIRPSFCPHGQRLHALSKIAGLSLLTVSNTAAQTSLFARKKIYYKTCLSHPFDSTSVLRRADICLKQAISIQRKEVIRCLMVQLRGRGIPFGRSAADDIGDAGHGMKATSGSGTSDR